jgi:hypothetical protein
VKKLSVQLSTLIAKVDALQNAVAPEITSSIPKGRARARLSGMARKRIARPLKPAGPVSVGGAPLTTPAQGWSSLQSPEGWGDRNLGLSTAAHDRVWPSGGHKYCGRAVAGLNHSGGFSLLQQRTPFEQVSGKPK